METSYIPVTRERVERLLVKALREKGRLNIDGAREICGAVTRGPMNWSLIRETVRLMVGMGKVRLCEDDPKYIEIVPGRYKDFNTDEPTEIEGSGEDA